MIEIQNVSFTYGRRKPLVLEDLNFSLESGAVYGLLGKNGTGKSTLLYLLSGLLRPTAGRVWMSGMQPQERRPELLRDIYLLPEEVNTPAVSMCEYVALNSPFYPNFSQELLEYCLREFELPLDMKLGELSMGQKKKAMVSFALATNTRLLLMDEPTNGLDIPAKSQFRKVVARSITDDRVMVISTHQVRDVELLLDHMLIIGGSRLLLDSTVSAVCERFCFSERALGEPMDDVIYAEPSLRGQTVITPNTTGTDTALNLELLFNALQVCPDKLLAELAAK